MSPPTQQPEFSVVVPCYNEEGAIAQTIDHLRTSLAQAGAHELLVVDDGSSDGTATILEQIAKEHTNLRILTHDRNRGYGAALKTGIRNAYAELIVITDADGTYPNERIPELVADCRNHDMVVGARTAEGVQYSKVRAVPKIFLKAWASWIARQEIPDINSGLRVFRKDAVQPYFGILPDGFSFTVTITLAMLTNYRPVKFVPIIYRMRIGKSKIQPIRDTLRFLMLILRTGTYFAPLRVFAPFVGVLGLLTLGSVTYDLFFLQNITDKTLLLFLFTFNTGLFSLLADMIDKRSPQ